MSAALPERVDIVREVLARRIHEGALPLAGMRRLCASLAIATGEARYKVEFGQDLLGIPWVAVNIDAELPLRCQRTLETFAYPVSIDQRLGVIASDADEVALPAGYEPLLVSDGHVVIADVIEDELLLALPVVPMKPGPPFEWNDGSAGNWAEETSASPFAVLETLKKH